MNLEESINGVDVAKWREVQLRWKWSCKESSCGVDVGITKREESPAI